ncbi:MAG: recombinase family protein [Roseburia sp.]|nr:recombinase family protein [Roseburia sp.]MDY5884212.1 recombinase family protein [Roseburia sp.]
MGKESLILNSKIGAIYIRVSTDKQEELSPDAQKRLLIDYAKANNIDVPMQYIFIENGISGRHADKRPEFQKMIGLAKSKDHPVDVILVWKFSRFARNQEESIVYKSLLKKNNVDVISISEPLVDGPFGSLIERIIEWMDEYYSIRLSGEVMRGMSENALRGNYQAPAPVGYKSVGSKQPPVIDTETAIIPLTCRKMFLEDNKSPRSIAQYLNACGYKTKRGNLFDARGVIYILVNPFYAGKNRWNLSERGRRLKDPSEVIYSDGNWEPLWSYDDYKKMAAKVEATRLRNANTGRKSKRDSAYANHWLMSIMRCSRCGKSLAFQNRNGVPGYNCWSYAKGQCDESHYIRVNLIEKFVIEGLDNLLHQDKLQYEIINHVDLSDSKTIDIERKLKKLDTKEKRAKDAYINEIDSLEEYKENKKRIENERKKLQQELDKLNVKKKYDTSELDQMMFKNITDALNVLKDEKAENEEKANAIRSVVEYIVFDRKNTSLDFHLKLVL